MDIVRSDDKNNTGGMSVKYSVRTAMMVFFSGLVLFASGCGPMKKQAAPGDTAQARQGQVNCIGVLPATTIPVAQGAAGEKQAKILQQGASVLNRLLSQKLQGQAQVRFVGQDLLAGLSLTGGESSQALAKLVGERIGCNAVMASAVSRFNERDGGKYSAEKPASVAFDFRLLAVESGAVLWSATFDEAQRSVSENLYDWNKARSRGFSWVSAEELMAEGVRTKLANSPYFRNPEKDQPAPAEPAAK